MQETQDWYLVWDEHTRLEATQAVHNYWARALSLGTATMTPHTPEPALHNKKSLQGGAPTTGEEPRLPASREKPEQQLRPAQPK